MRIISGSAKGRKLFTPTDGIRTIRPTADRAREALFNIIAENIFGKRVLDLFAGTGAFGCEALSRGAGSVCFVDNNRRSLDLVRKNIALIDGGKQRSSIIHCDLRRGLGALVSPPPLPPFDVIFADPPYGRDLSQTILHLIDQQLVIAERTVVIIEERKGYFPPSTLAQLYLSDQRCYGNTVFTFFHAIKE